MNTTRRHAAMPRHFRAPGPNSIDPVPYGRAFECGRLGLLVGAVLSGEIRTPIDRGEAGVSKSALRSPHVCGLRPVAAVEAAREPAPVRRTVQRPGITLAAPHPAEAAGLLPFGDRVTFRHPLVRSALREEGTPQHLRAAYRAPAEVIDPAVDAERRAWHLQFEPLDVQLACNISLECLSAAQIAAVGRRSARAAHKTKPGKRCQGARTGAPVTGADQRQPQRRTDLPRSAGFTCSTADGCAAHIPASMQISNFARSLRCSPRRSSGTVATADDR